MALMFDALPKAKVLLGDKGYDAQWLRQALAQNGIAACIPSKVNRKVQIEYDKVLYRQRHKIENMFGRLKDWRRVHTRYDRLRTHLHVRHHHRRRCHLLAMINES
jgi:transposase